MSDTLDADAGSATPSLYDFAVYLEDDDGYPQRMDVRSRSVIGAVARAQEVFPDYHVTKVERL